MTHADPGMHVAPAVNPLAAGRLGALLTCNVMQRCPWNGFLRSYKSGGTDEPMHSTGKLRSAPQNCAHRCLPSRT